MFFMPPSAASCLRPPQAMLNLRAAETAILQKTRLPALLLIIPRLAVAELFAAHGFNQLPPVQSPMIQVFPRHCLLYAAPLQFPQDA